MFTTRNILLGATGVLGIAALVGTVCYFSKKGETKKVVVKSEPTTEGNVEVVEEVSKETNGAMDMLLSSVNELQNSLEAIEAIKEKTAQEFNEMVQRKTEELTNLSNDLNARVSAMEQQIDTLVQLVGDIVTNGDDPELAEAIQIIEEEEMRNIAESKAAEKDGIEEESDDEDIDDEEEDESEEDEVELETGEPETMFDALAGGREDEEIEGYEEFEEDLDDDEEKPTEEEMKTLKSMAIEVDPDEEDEGEEEYDDDVEEIDYHRHEKERIEALNSLLGYNSADEEDNEEQEEEDGDEESKDDSKDDEGLSNIVKPNYPISPEQLKQIRKNLEKIVKFEEPSDEEIELQIAADDFSDIEEDLKIAPRRNMKKVKINKKQQHKHKKR